MEINSIQMTASNGHAVTYTIAPIFIYLCISPMASRILYFKAVWLVGVTLIFDDILQIIVQRCQIVVPRWPNDISSAADNAIFKKRAQNIGCSFGCVARSDVLLKPNVDNILLFNFWEQKLVQHGSITIAIDCNALSLLIFEEKWPNYASAPKPNSDSFWVLRLFNVCVLVFCALNATILLIYVSTKIKKASSEKVIFWPNFSEEYTPPHSFDRRIKLIICQIRHELSVTNHEISSI